MKKTIKTDKLITIMAEFEREQGEAWSKADERYKTGNAPHADSWSNYAKGIGHCLRELEELIRD